MGIIKYSFSFVLLSFVLACTSDAIKMDVQGHRGWRGLYPENSLEAFEAAIDLGVSTLELDVIISGDKQVVISHEPWISHEICNISEEQDGEKALNMFEMTYDEIRAFDCGSKPHPRFAHQKKLKVSKPRLEDLLIRLKEKDPDKNIHLNIETKTTAETDHINHPAPKEFVDLLMKKLEEFDVLDISCIQSFDVRTLQEVKKLNKDQEVALLVDEGENYKNKIAELGFNPEIVSPYFPLVTAEMIQDLHSKNILVKPWTVNETSDMQEMIDMNVDGIITDYPGRLIKLIGEKHL